MAPSISLTGPQRRALRIHAEWCEPGESCAILYGSSYGSRVSVQDVFLAKNIDADPLTRFTISNEELIAAYGRAEDAGTQVVGIFHSHPRSEARPSATDVRFMEINPVVWVIYSGAESGFGAFVLDGEDVKEIEITD